MVHVTRVFFFDSELACEHEALRWGIELRETLALLEVYHIMINESILHYKVPKKRNNFLTTATVFFRSQKFAFWIQQHNRTAQTIPSIKLKIPATRRTIGALCIGKLVEIVACVFSSTITALPAPIMKIPVSCKNCCKKCKKDAVFLNKGSILLEIVE